MRRWRQLWLLEMFVCGALFAATPSRPQEPSPTPPPERATAPSTTPKTTKKYSHANDFLIRGTVFNEKALSFPDVELRIRRTGEKKFRWQSITNSRGEFAMRVPMGGEYEMVVHNKGFKDQVRTIDTKNGLTEESAVFRMEPVVAEKK